MRTTKLILLATAFGLGLGAGAVVMSLASGSAGQASGKQPSAERKPLYWAAPMDKSYRSDSPGLSPMGMELIPVYADDESEGDDRNLVRINPAVENNIGVRTAIVATSEALPAVETVGTVQIDDDNKRESVSRMWASMAAHGFSGWTARVSQPGRIHAGCKISKRGADDG